MHTLSVNGSLPAAATLAFALVVASSCLGHAEDSPVARLYSEAQRAYLRGDNPTAKKLFTQVLSANPQHVGARNSLRMIALEDSPLGRTNPLENRLKQIVIPTISFKDVSLSAATQFLKQQTEKITSGDLKPNFILSLPSNYADDTRVSLELTDIPFLDAVDYICRLSNTQYRVERHGIVIQSRATPTPP